MMILLNIDQKILPSWLHTSQYTSPVLWHAQASQPPAVHPGWDVDKETGNVSVFLGQRTSLSPRTLKIN